MTSRNRETERALQTDMQVSTLAEATKPPAADRHPGVTLRDFLQRANLTPEQFARRLNRLAAEQGLARRVDDKTPYKWCRGSIPRPPWPALAACELSSQLGTHVTVEDLGWSNDSTAGPRFLAADADLDLPWTVRGALTAIGRVSDQAVCMDRLFLPVSGTALTKLALDWLT